MFEEKLEALEVARVKLKIKKINSSSLSFVADVKTESDIFYFWARDLQTFHSRILPRDCK